MGESRSLISFDEATDRILATVRALPPETIPMEEARGRVLAAPVRAPEDIPSSPISAMDGYAVPRRVLEVLQERGEAEATVAGEVAAGLPDFSECPGDGAVVRIFTGGVVPSWAAAVVVQERARRVGDRVMLTGAVPEGAQIRAIGSDIRAGEEALAAGAVLHPPALGLLVSLGIERVEVGARPRVGILVTGTEVVESGVLARGQVRDSNGPALEAAARACGAGPVLRARAPDDPDLLRRELQALMSRVDLLVTSGGVSVGDHDHMKTVLEDLGVRRLFWGVAQRPGKPLYAGTLDGLPVLGLPGNPAAALATFLCHGWPVLRRLQGAVPERVRSLAVLGAKATKARGFTAMLRGRRWMQDATVMAAPSGPQDSHQMLPFARSDCLLLCPPDTDVLEPGTAVDVLPYPWSPAP